MPNNPNLSAWLKAQRNHAIRSGSLESLAATEAPTCQDLARALATLSATPPKKPTTFSVAESLRWLEACAQFRQDQHEASAMLAAHASHTLSQQAKGDGAFQGFIAAAVGVTQ